MTLKLNGSTTKPQVVIPYGEMATVTQTSDAGELLEITVVPTEKTVNGKNVIDMRFTIAKVIGAVREILARPRITTSLGTEATISQKGEEQKNTFALSVVPTRVL